MTNLEAFRNCIYIHVAYTLITYFIGINYILTMPILFLSYYCLRNGKNADFTLLAILNLLDVICHITHSIKLGFTSVTDYEKYISFLNDVAAIAIIAFKLKFATIAIKISEEI